MLQVWTSALLRQYIDGLLAFDGCFYDVCNKAPSIEQK